MQTFVGLFINSVSVLFFFSAYELILIIGMDITLHLLEVLTFVL